MVYLTRKEIDAGDYEFGSLLKQKDIDEVGSIRLWCAEAGAIVERYQVDEGGFYICCEINEFCSIENLKTTKLAEACQAFNTILQTMKA